MAYDVRLGSVYLKLDFPRARDGTSSASGTQTVQDITPSDAEYKNSVPGFGDDTPYSARTYAATNGSVGKWSEVESPGDTSRPYLCTLDATRPGKLSRWLDLPGTPTIQATPGGSTGNPFGNRYSPFIDAATLGQGFLNYCTGGTDAGYWWYTYNPSTMTLAPQVRCFNMSSFGPAPPIQDQLFSNDTARRAPAPWTSFSSTGRSLFVPLAARDNGGVIDLMTAYPQAVIAGGTTFWHIMLLGNNVVTFEQLAVSSSTPGMRISLRDRSSFNVLTPATLSGVPAPELGNNLIQVDVPDVVMCHKPVVYNGAIYFASDRAVYKLIYDDNNARLLVVPIRTTFTRVTAAPAIFQGSLYIGSGNTLYKWTPGQQEWTPTPVDAFGVLPENRGGGLVQALFTASDGLYMVLYGSTSNTNTLLRLDANGTITERDQNAQTQSPIWWYFNGAGQSNAPVIGVWRNDGTTIPLYEANRDPTFLAASARPQVAGSGFMVTPFDPATNYGDRKDLLAIAAQVAGVSATTPIRIYYQLDTDYLLPDDLDTANGGFGTPTTTNTGAVMVGQGQWTLALSCNATTSGLSLVNSTTGEYGGYATLSLTARAKQYRSIRWCVEIVGDPTGTKFPQLLGFKYSYAETPAKYVLWTVRAVILAEDPDLADALAAGYAVPQTPADVYATQQTLYGYSTSGTFQPFVDLNGDSRLVKVTKFRADPQDLEAQPTPVPTVGHRRVRKYVVTLALQEADSAA